MAYKVTNKKQQSAMIELHEGGIQYYEHCWVRSKYPLFVFKYLKDAENFINGFVFTYHIWECKTKGLKIQHSSCVNALVDHWIEDFWKNGTNPGAAPRGTYIADEVMLTKRVR